MEVTTLIIAIIGAVTGVGSLFWQVSYLEGERGRGQGDREAGDADLR
jgi:hypothetical protein